MYNKLVRHHWYEHFIVCSVYLLLTLLLLAPILPHFTSTIPGNRIATEDGWQNVWNIWWFYHAIRSGNNPFYTPLLYYPEGATLYNHTFNPSNGLLVLPVTALFGPVTGYNTAVLFAFVLSALGGYGLSLHVSRHRLAAFFGGLVLAFSPFHITKLWDGHLNLLSLQWLAFYALFLLRTAETCRWRDALLAGLFLAFIGYTSWYYLLFVAIYSLLFVVLWFPAQADWRQQRHMLFQMITVALVGSLLLLPALLPMLALTHGATVSINPDSSVEVLLMRSANLLDFFMPSALHPLWGTEVVQMVSAWHPFTGAWNIAPGYSVLVLALLALFVARREAWRWWVLGLAAFVLALGPILHVGSWRSSVYLPYNGLLHVPGVAPGERPNHFIVITLLVFVPLVALSMRWLLAQISPAQRVLLYTGLLALLALEFVPQPLPRVARQPHPYYHTLANQDGALMELPPRPRQSASMQAQLIHKRPMMGGYLSRSPPYPFVERTFGVRQLWFMQAEDARLLRTGPDDALVIFNFYNIRHIVVNKDELSTTDQTQLDEVLRCVLPDVAPAFADVQLEVYAIPEVPARPVLFAGAGWHEEENSGTRRWRWMREQGEIMLINPSEQPARIALQLSAQSYREPRDVRLQFNDNNLSIWRFPQGNTPQTLHLHLLLPPGESSLWLSATTAVGEEDGRPISIALTGLHLQSKGSGVR
jgi:hypothetical protein